jgi:hypothetical protein
MAIKKTVNLARRYRLTQSKSKSWRRRSHAVVYALGNCGITRRIVSSQSLEKGLDEITWKRPKVLCQLCRSHNLLLTSKKILSELSC